jgi:hypothetical protein
MEGAVSNMTFSIDRSLEERGSTWKTKKAGCNIYRQNLEVIVVTAGCQHTGNSTQGGSSWATSHDKNEQ